MPKFMFVFRGGALVEKGLSPSDLGAHLNKWTRWVEELVTTGRRESGYAVQLGGKVVSGARKTVMDGPYAETKDIVTGNLVIRADSIDEATRIALGCPIYEFDGSVEVRAILEAEARA